MRIRIGLVLLLALALTASPVWAMECPVYKWADEKAQSDSYGVRAGGLLVRGLDRIVFSPFELFYHTYDETVHRPTYGLGVLKGLGIGLFRTVEKIGVGVVDIVGSPVPGFHGLAVSHKDACCEKK